MLNTNLALVFVLITCNYIDHVLSVLDLYIFWLCPYTCTELLRRIRRFKVVQLKYFYILLTKRQERSWLI